MSSKENTRKPRKIKVRINYKHNAEGINTGDLLLVQPTAVFKDADIAVLKSKYTGAYITEYIFNTTRRNAHGQSFKFFIASHRTGRGIKTYLYEDPKKNKRYQIIGKVIRKLEEAEKSQEQESRTHHRVNFDWPYFGVHKDDILTVEATKDVKPGQLILIKDEDESDYFHRVCCVNGETVRVTSDTNEPHDEPLSLIIGKAVEINHKDCSRTKAEALRARLRDLGDDITDSTEAFKIEREIYDLEHPPEEEEDANSDEWPEVIGDE